MFRRGWTRTFRAPPPPPQRPGKSLHVAVDAEFLKVAGEILARSVAFVPFVPGCCSTPSQLRVGEDVASGGLSRPVVVELDPRCVAHQCDILPAGYCLKDLCASFSASLDSLFAPPRHSALLPLPRHMASSGGDLRLRAKPNPTMPYAIDPYFVPNYLRWGDALAALYAEPLTSTSFAQAANDILLMSSPYGSGKPLSPSMASLLKRDSAAFQQLLRSRFSSAAEWRAWLEACYQQSLASLEQTHASLLRYCVTTQATLPPPDASVGKPSWLRSASLGEVPPLLYPCSTLEEFSETLRCVWSDFVGQWDSCKFYSYGSADVGVLRNSVRHACAEVRKASAANASHEENTGLIPPSSRPSQLCSPMQLTLTDITSSSFFLAAGYEVERGLTPRLEVALRKMAKKSTWAAQLLESPEEHNPLWDAAALAAVGTMLLPAAGAPHAVGSRGAAPSLTVTSKDS